MSLHQAYAVVLGSTTLAGLTGLDSTINHEVKSEVGIGSLYPQFAAVVGLKPKVQFASRAVQTILGVTGSTGAAISSGTTLKAYYAKLADGAPALGSVHQSYTFDRGLLLPRRLQCSHQQDATLDCEAVCYSSDGVTSPMIVSSSAALPTIVQDNIRHTLQSASVGGVDLGCITDVSIDFGVGAETIGCKSDVYDKHVSKSNGVTPTISITTLDVDVLSSITVPGKAATHANTSIVFRNRALDGILFATGGAISLLTITANGVMTYEQNQAQGTKPASATIKITCAWDGTNAPLLIA